MSSFLGEFLIYLIKKIPNTQLEFLFTKFVMEILMYLSWKF